MGSETWQAVGGIVESLPPQGVAGRFRDEQHVLVDAVAMWHWVCSDTKHAVTALAWNRATGGRITVAAQWEGRVYAINALSDTPHRVQLFKVFLPTQKRRSKS